MEGRNFKTLSAYNSIDASNGKKIVKKLKKQKVNKSHHF